MLPYLFESIFSDYILIPTYGILLAAGFSVAYFLSLVRAAKRHLELRHIEAFFLISVIGGLLGARLFHVALEWRSYQDHPLDALAFWQGGLVFYGGLLLASTIAVAYAWRNKLDILSYSDAIAPCALLGTAIGRIGCLAAGCCWGIPWANGIVFRHPHAFAEPKGVALFPTQPLEAVTLFIAAIGIFILQRRMSVALREQFKGVETSLGLIAYSLTRFAIEFYRGDESRGLVPSLGLSQAQVLSAFLAVAGFAILSTVLLGAQTARRKHHFA